MVMQKNSARSVTVMLSEAVDIAESFPWHLASG
jgi:hypothetical protein